MATFASATTVTKTFSIKWRNQSTTKKKSQIPISFTDYISAFLCRIHNLEICMTILNCIVQLPNLPQRYKHKLLSIISCKIYMASFCSSTICRVQSAHTLTPVFLMNNPRQVSQSIQFITKHTPQYSWCVDMSISFRCKETADYCRLLSCEPQSTFKSVKLVILKLI